MQKRNLDLNRPKELTENALMALHIAEKSDGTPQQERAMLMVQEFLAQALLRVEDLRKVFDEPSASSGAEYEQYDR